MKMIDEISLKKRWVNLQCRGYSNDRIAEETNSDPKWVRHFLQRNNLKALERMAKMRAAERAKQVMLLEHMIDDAYRAWEQSRYPEEVIETTEEPVNAQIQTTVQPVAGAPGTYTQVAPPTTVIRTKKKVTYQCGDVSYLRAVQEFMRDIRSILKIDDGTKRLDFSLTIPSDDSIQATLNVQDIAAQQLHDWNAEQKERLNKLLEMPEPEIVDGPDRPLSIDENENGMGNGDVNNPGNLKDS